MITIIKLFIFVYIIVVWVIVIKRKRYKKLVQSTMINLPRYGNNMAFIGATGDGKTSSAVGTCIQLTKYIDYELRRRMDDIRKSLYHVDFSLLIDKMESSVYLSFDNIFDRIDYVMNPFIEDNFQFFYVDFLTVENKKKMLQKYLYYWYVLNERGILVYAKGYLFNRFTGQNAMLYDPSSIELRNVVVNKNYQLDIAEVRLNDESSIDDGNVYSSSKDKKLSGAVEQLALIRNMMEGLTFIVNCKQISENEVKLYRSLINSSFQIYDRDDFLGSYRRTCKFLDFIFSIYSFFLKLCLRIKCLFTKGIKYKNFILDYELQNNKLSRVSYRFNQFKKLLKSFGFIRVRCRRYYRSDDVGKTNKDLYEQIVLYYDLWDCYGTYDTYEYACLRQYYQRHCEYTVDESVSKMDEENRVKMFINTINK